MLELQHKRFGYSLDASFLLNSTRNVVPDAKASQKQVLLLLFLRSFSEAKVRVPRVRALGSEPTF